MEENQIKTALVVSAHSADFVWRAGGAIALYAEPRVEGEDRLPLLRRAGRVGQALERRGMTLDRVKALRREEALAAAAVLGGEVEFFDCGDYPMNFTPAQPGSTRRHLPIPSSRSSS